MANDGRNVTAIPPLARENAIRSYHGERNGGRQFRLYDGRMMTMAEYAKWNGDYYGWGTATSREPALNQLLHNAGFQARKVH